MPVTVFDARGQAGPLRRLAPGSLAIRLVSICRRLRNFMGWARSMAVAGRSFAKLSFRGRTIRRHAQARRRPQRSSWAGGQDWWTSVGYWPYDDPIIARPDCWKDPTRRISKERCNSERIPSLVSYYHSRRFQQLKWSGRARRISCARLVVHISPRIWIVADNSSGGVQKKVQTIWTTSPNISVIEDARSKYIYASAKGTRRVLKIILLGPPAMKIIRYRGSRTPFAAGSPAADSLTPQRRFSRSSLPKILDIFHLAPGG